MSSAQSRLGIVAALGAARRGVGHCVDAIPVPAGALKMGAAAFAGAALLRLLVASRRAASCRKAAAATPPPVQTGAGRYLLSETVLTLLLPLCRRLFLGDIGPDGTLSGGVLERLLNKKER